eukprot:g19875.t1
MSSASTAASSSSSSSAGLGSVAHAAAPVHDGSFHLVEPGVENPYRFLSREAREKIGVDLYDKFQNPAVLAAIYDNTACRQCLQQYMKFWFDGQLALYPHLVWDFKSLTTLKAATSATASREAFQVCLAAIVYDGYADFFSPDVKTLGGMFGYRVGNVRRNGCKMPPGLNSSLHRRGDFYRNPSASLAAEVEAFWQRVSLSHPDRPGWSGDAPPGAAEAGAVNPSVAASAVPGTEPQHESAMMQAIQKAYKDMGRDPEKQEKKTIAAQVKQPPQDPGAPPPDPDNFDDADADANDFGFDFCPEVEEAEDLGPEEVPDAVGAGDLFRAVERGVTAEEEAWAKDKIAKAKSRFDDSDMCPEIVVAPKAANMRKLMILQVDPQRVYACCPKCEIAKDVTYTQTDKKEVRVVKDYQQDFLCGGRWLRGSCDCTFSPTSFHGLALFDDGPVGVGTSRGRILFTILGYTATGPRILGVVFVDTPSMVLVADVLKEVVDACTQVDTVFVDVGCTCRTHLDWDPHAREFKQKQWDYSAYWQSIFGDRPFDVKLDRFHLIQRLKHGLNMARKLAPTFLKIVGEVVAQDDAEGVEIDLVNAFRAYEEHGYTDRPLFNSKMPLVFASFIGHVRGGCVQDTASVRAFQEKQQQRALEGKKASQHNRES